MKENSDAVASEAFIMTPQIGSNAAYTKTSLFSKIALAVGIFNGLIMSVLVYQIAPVTSLVARNSHEIEGSIGFLNSMNDFSTSTVRLVHGSLPSLLGELLQSDINTAASDALGLAESVHNSVCMASPDKEDYANKQVWGIAKYSDLMRSILTQVAAVPDLSGGQAVSSTEGTKAGGRRRLRNAATAESTVKPVASPQSTSLDNLSEVPTSGDTSVPSAAPSAPPHHTAKPWAKPTTTPYSADDGPADDADDVQLTGEGGLLTDLLTYTTSYIIYQTDPTEWAKASCAVATLSDNFRKYMPWYGQYGPECGTSNMGTGMHWDVSDSALYYLNYIQETAAELCKIKPLNSEVPEKETSQQGSKNE